MKVTKGRRRRKVCLPMRNKWPAKQGHRWTQGKPECVSPMSSGNYLQVFPLFLYLLASFFLIQDHFPLHSGKYDHCQCLSFILTAQQLETKSNFLVTHSKRYQGRTVIGLAYVRYPFLGQSVLTWVQDISYGNHTEVLQEQRSSQMKNYFRTDKTNT